MSNWVKSKLNEVRKRRFLKGQMMLSPKDLIVEIRLKGDAANNCFFSMSEALGLKYDYFLANPIEEGITNINSSDVVLDEQRFKNKIKELNFAK